MDSSALSTIFKILSGLALFFIIAAFLAGVGVGHFM